jgi:hypothetical protein
MRWQKALRRLVPARQAKFERFLEDCAADGLLLAETFYEDRAALAGQRAKNQRFVNHYSVGYKVAPSGSRRVPSGRENDPTVAI